MRFLVVALEIRSRSDLRPLLDAWKRKVHLLHVGRLGRAHHLRVQIAAGNLPGVNRQIQRLCRIVKALPPKLRRLWDEAGVRDLDIGIEAPQPGQVCVEKLDLVTLEEAIAIDARVVMTVYPSRDS